MTITLANKEHLEKIYSLTKACASDMISRGIFQWNEYYPSKQQLEDDITKGEMFCVLDDGNVLGIVVITETEDVEYKDVNWLTENGNSVYIHRLAVHPNHQGKGHARELMDFSEGYAESMGYASVRLDTFSKNTRNNKFYRSRNYKQLDDIFFDKQSEFPFHCYELVF